MGPDLSGSRDRPGAAAARSRLLRRIFANLAVFAGQNADVKELGEIIDDGQAALVIVGESKVEQAIDKAALKADKHVAKELDVKSRDIDKAVREAAACPTGGAERVKDGPRGHVCVAGQLQHEPVTDTASCASTSG